MAKIKLTYEKEVKDRLSRITQSDKSILTEDNIKHLPKLVQKYLSYVGVIGKEKVKCVKLRADALMKLNPKKDWSKFKAEQYNFFDNEYTRLFYMKTKMFGISVSGLHTYTKEEARMLIKLAGLITVLDARGPEMRIGDTTTLFNDMCAFAPATLIDKRIKWEEIGELSVKATFEAYNTKITAILYFNEAGQLINFISDDRYYIPMDGSSRKAIWSTPLGNYQEYNGLRLATYGEAIWKFPEGDYCYAKFTNVSGVKYNMDVLEY
jgi:hypothetical protein